MPKIITEEHVEENVLSILKSLDYNIIRGSNEEYLHGGSSALMLEHTTTPKTGVITPKTEAL